LVMLWVCYITADGEDASKYNEILCI